MAQCLICINSENSHNFSKIQQNAFKLGQNMKLNDLTSPMALSAIEMSHVTCYECFMGLSEN